MSPWRSSSHHEGSLTSARRGKGVSRGLVMAVLGDRHAREVTTREIEDLLRSVASTDVAPRTVNKVRQLVCAIFNYGMRPSARALTGPRSGNFRAALLRETRSQS